MADAFDVQYRRLVLEADLPEGGQVIQPFADVEVTGVVDGRFGA